MQLTKLSLRRLACFFVTISAVFGLFGWSFAARYAKHLENCKFRDGTTNAEPQGANPQKSEVQRVTEGWFFALQTISTIGFGTTHMGCVDAQSIATELMIVTLFLWLVAFPVLFKWIVG